MTDGSNQKVYNDELQICQTMFDKQGGCNWGQCQHCGVLPLLHKLYKGILLEDKDQIQKLKTELLETRIAAKTFISLDNTKFMNVIGGKK